MARNSGPCLGQTKGTLKTQCSITLSALGSLTESPLHVLQGNQTGTIEFWRVSARGQSGTPALCKFSCSQPSGNDTTDVMNYYNYVISHTWTQGTTGHQFGQTDTLDAGTLMPISSSIDIDDDNLLGGDPFPWNDNFGYLYGDPGHASSSGADWDKSSTRAGIAAALDAVNWTALWAGTVSEPNNFAYDRAAISPNQSVTLPYGGSNTGDLIPSHVAIGPNRTLSGTFGEVSNFSEGGFSISEGLGVSLERAQLQVRNYHGPPIPYFIYEVANPASAVTVLGSNTVRDNSSLSLVGNINLYRKLSEGTWTHDLQIIQLPDAATDGPQTVSAGAGSGVRNGTAIGMVVGMTFQEYLETFVGLGPTWADYVF